MKYNRNNPMRKNRTTFDARAYREAVGPGYQFAGVAQRGMERRPSAY